MKITKRQCINSFQLGLIQFLNWGICTISWRSVAQANIRLSIITDTTLGTLQFFVFKKMLDGKNDNSFILWLGYTVGGVLGTIVGIYSSLYFLGK